MGWRVIVWGYADWALIVCLFVSDLGGGGKQTKLRIGPQITNCGIRSWYRKG